MNYSVYLIVVAIMIILAAVLVFPLRLRHAVTMNLNISASPERVWHVLTVSRGARSWRPEIIDIASDAGDPELVTQICRYNNGSLKIVMRVLEMVPCKRLIMRCEQAGAVRLPLGERAFAAFKLIEMPGGTRLAFREEGCFTSLLSYCLFALAQRASLRRLRYEAEGANSNHAAQPQLELPTPVFIAGSTAAAAAIAVLLGWQLGILVLACLSVMEYGHALVLRYAGERPSCATLLPFVGGAVVMGGGRASAYEDALRALSGPAAVTGLVIVLTFLAALVNQAEIAGNIRVAAGISAFIAALFLLPFYPLNGGWLFSTLVGNLPAMAFRFPSILVAGVVLFWSLSAGQIIAAGLAAGLIYELAVPVRSGIIVDRSLSPRNALMIAGIYASMNLVAYTALIMFFVT